MSHHNLIVVCIILSLGLSGTLGLTCWSTNGPKNKYDVTSVITETVCQSNHKSCKAVTYNVDTMWFRDMGCTEVDKNECNVIKKGMAEEFSCFCKTDYCNSVSVLGPKPMMLLILTTIIVLLNG